MNISKIIFKQNNKTYQIDKSYYFKYETKYPYLGYVRFKRYYSNWKLKLKDDLKPDYMSNKTVYSLLTRHTNNYSYECFNHKNELINKDFKFYKYITIKDMKLNKGIKDLSLASKLINELSMELLIK